jgi:hypothetical protein
MATTRTTRLQHSLANGRALEVFLGSRGPLDHEERDAVPRHPRLGTLHAQPTGGCRAEGQP